MLREYLVAGLSVRLTALSPFKSGFKPMPTS